MTPERGDHGKGAALRPLTIRDLDLVVSIDRRLSGGGRRGFYEKRLAAALREPGGFVYLGIEDAGTLAGFVFARLIDGEFGEETRVAQLDAIGIDPARGGHGLGHALMDGLADILRHKNVRELQSQVAWTDHELLRFFAATGFELAPRTIVQRPVTDPVAF